MKVNVYSATTFDLINVRHVDEVVAHEYEHAADDAMFQAECERATAELKSSGRYWIGNVYLSRRTRDGYEAEDTAFLEMEKAARSTLR